MQFNTKIQMIRKLVFFWLLILNGVLLFGQKFESPASNKEQFEAQYQKRIKLDSINGVYIPKNTNDAFDQLNKKIDAKSKEKFMRTSEDTISRIAVKSLGSWMIRNWSFFEGSRLAAYLKTIGVFHPEDQAAFLVIGYYRYLNKLPLEEEKRIKEIQEKRKAEVNARKLKGTLLSEEKLKSNKK